MEGTGKLRCNGSINYFFPYNSDVNNLYNAKFKFAYFHGLDIVHIYIPFLVLSILLPDYLPVCADELLSILLPDYLPLCADGLVFYLACGTRTFMIICCCCLMPNTVILQYRH